MANYTLITTRSTGGRSTYVLDYPADAQIIADAWRALGEAVVAVAVARGTLASEMQWLGSWRYLGGEPQWRASDMAPFPLRPTRPSPPGSPAQPQSTRYRPCGG